MRICTSALAFLSAFTMAKIIHGEKPFGVFNRAMELPVRPMSVIALTPGRSL